METIFEKILSRQIPCKKVYEDENFLAFLDINPLTNGHTLVIPKQKSETFLETSDEILAKAMPTLKKIGNALKLATNAWMINIAVIGEDVAYTHFHLIPRMQGDGAIQFTHKGDKTRLDEMQKLITQAL